MLFRSIEVNLFYRTVKRERLIASFLKKAGAKRVYGLSKRHRIPGLSSERANVDDALWGADVVLVSLEDGDRTGALKRTGKRVVAVDLNPLSRTAQEADVTVVDNIVRAFPNMIAFAKDLSGVGRLKLTRICEGFNNKKNLSGVISKIRGGF